MFQLLSARICKAMPGQITKQWTAKYLAWTKLRSTLSIHFVIVSLLFVTSAILEAKSTLDYLFIRLRNTWGIFSHCWSIEIQIRPRREFSPILHSSVLSWLGNNWPIIFEALSWPWWWSKQVTMHHHHSGSNSHASAQLNLAESLVNQILLSSLHSRPLLPL